MIVVTGAAGFIGSNIVADLERLGKGPIAVCDWFGSGEKWLNLAKRSIAAFVAPERLIDFLNANASAISAVIHMGAISATTEKDVDRLVELNINFSVSLWDWCAAARVPFLYASSAATYGGREADFSDQDDAESLSQLRPLNGYGWSKKAVDQIFAARVAEGRPTPPQWIGFKFFNVYGPNEYHKDDMRSVISKLFDTIQAGEGIKLFKSHRPDIRDGEQLRDFVYVKDCSKIACWALENPTVSGIFNLGTGKARSFLDLAMLVRSRLKQHVPIEFIDMPEAIRAKYQYFTQADTTKIKLAGMNFEFTSLEDGIADYLDHYLLRDDRYR
ncbi:ADP-glyceromanno-heptose 6-epimerase [Bradyrhizobium sp. NC92]|uniref:ADP-glyceromanno-heptose 6-epimerase n=1 Tax=Bradyrhizobium sp. (strain NC92) TaxID=55395 RepID=UPI0021AA5140|nr:ADP-glyceromanno-heptose 6-epimerase [Bradyrhizobium sp. NC92]UWU67620.1 ADP-glyceromanno-heptose 6-epimerase [Bradyrhizobium sp. NC92]